MKGAHLPPFSLEPKEVRDPFIGIHLLLGFMVLGLWFNHQTDDQVAVLEQPPVATADGSEGKKPSRRAENRRMRRAQKTEKAKAKYALAQPTEAQDQSDDESDNTPAMEGES